MTNRVIRFSKNESGRDFIVGDIHGCFSALQSHLDSIRFNPDSGDRLFSVGDLVDRGPECEASIEWLAKPWFFAVAGNHEDYAIRWPNCYMDAGMYIAHGGAWNAFLSTDQSLVFADAFRELPIAIELETDGGLVGIVHADCPLSNWADFSGALKTGWVKSTAGELRNSKKALDSLIDAAQWSRNRYQLASVGFAPDDVADVRAVVVGHTPLLDGPEWVGNVFHIDTGACYEGGSFTVVDASTLKPVGKVQEAA